jgi:hypothetical protein
MQILDGEMARDRNTKQGALDGFVWASVELAMECFRALLKCLEEC